MRRIAIWLIAVIFFAGTTPIFAADEDKSSPTPNKEAYEHANENARFNRTGDLKDKEAMKAARKAEKETEKTKKEADRAQRKAEKEAKKKQKGMGKETKKMKKSFGK